MSAPAEPRDEGPVCEECGRHVVWDERIPGLRHTGIRVGPWHQAVEARVLEPVA